MCMTLSWNMHWDWPYRGLRRTEIDPGITRLIRWFPPSPARRRSRKRIGALTCGARLAVGEKNGPARHPQRGKTHGSAWRLVGQASRPEGEEARGGFSGCGLAPGSFPLFLFHFPNPFSKKVLGTTNKDITETAIHKKNTMLQHECKTCF